MADFSLQVESAHANADAQSIAWDAMNDFLALALDIESAAALIRMASQSDVLDEAGQSAVYGMAQLVGRCKDQAEELAAQYEARSKAARVAGGKVVDFPAGKGGDHGQD